MTKEDTLTRQLEESIAIVQSNKANGNPVGIRQKLLAIMKEVSYIQKDKRNDFHKYNYASESVIKAKLHDALVKYGVLFHMDCVDITERLAANGKDTITTQRFAYWFEDVETGELSVVKHMNGSGADSLDKSVFKSTVGALKYALTTTFLIATGDDPEEVSGEEKAALKKAVEEKLEAAKNYKPKHEPDPNKGWFQVMLDGFAAIKAEIGQEEYSRILGVNGFQHANQIPNRITATRIYKEMTALRKDGDGAA